MKKYLLVVFGDFTNTKSLTKIATGMTPIVDSPQLKLHQSVGSVVFHFESGVEKDDLQAKLLVSCFPLIFLYLYLFFFFLIIGGVEYRVD